MEIVILLFLTFMVLSSLVLLILVVGYYLLDPKQRRKRLLKIQAQIDYADARGTAHLKMLIDARSRLTDKANSVSKALKGSQDKLRKLQQDQSNELRDFIEVRIFEAHLNEIPGIGEKFGDMLKYHVFRTRLADLREAQYRIVGIGESRQVQINAWIKKWENQIPRLLEEEFLGKEEVLAKYAEKIMDTTLEVQRLESMHKNIMSNLNKATELINELRRVTVRDFEHAIIASDQNNGKVQAYLTGVFPEWEPMPGWFKEIIQEN